MAYQSDDEISIQSLQPPKSGPKSPTNITFKRHVSVTCAGCGSDILPFPQGNKYGMRHQVCYFKHDPSNNTVYFMSVKRESDDENEKEWGDAECTICDKIIGEFKKGNSRYLFRFPQRNILYEASNEHQLPSNANYYD